jgi:hypothetical protein
MRPAYAPMTNTFTSRFAPSGMPTGPEGTEVMKGAARLPEGVGGHRGEGGQGAGERAHVSGVDADRGREGPGKTALRIELVATEDIGIRLLEAGSLTKTRTWREWRWSILILAAILTIVSAVTGVGGPVGVAVGVVLGLIGTVIGFWASTTHKDTETTRF